jgi:hypothetical protein
VVAVVDKTDLAALQALVVLAVVVLERKVVTLHTEAQARVRQAQ